MIRKPETDWRRERRSVGQVRQIAAGSVVAARAARHVARGLVLWGFALLWGYCALAAGLFAGNFPTLIGVGALAALMAWSGTRQFGKARDVSGPTRRA